VSLRSASAGLLAVAFAVGAVLAWRSDGSTDRDQRGDGRATAPLATDLDGATLFAAKGCVWCHRSTATDPLIDDFPDLTDIAEWGGTRRPGLDAAEYITESVRSPTAFISPVWEDHGGPTSGMPALVVSDSELNAIIEYLLDRNGTE
jgi:hypothetical protein